MKTRTARRLGYLALALALLAAAVFYLTLLGLWPWSRVNCLDYDVDLASGRIRQMRYLLWLPVRGSLEDTPLTLALLPEDLAEARPQWRRVLRLSPAVGNSPHYAYHGAIAQMRGLEPLWECADFTAEARRAIALRILELWRQAGGDRDAQRYLHAIYALITPGGTRVRIDVADLPRR